MKAVLATGGPPDPNPPQAGTKISQRSRLYTLGGWLQRDHPVLHRIRGPIELDGSLRERRRVSGRDANLEDPAPGIRRDAR
jgi:hypothetical protein